MAQQLNVLRIKVVFNCSDSANNFQLNQKQNREYKMGGTAYPWVFIPKITVLHRNLHKFISMFRPFWAFGIDCFINNNLYKF